MHSLYACVCECDIHQCDLRVYSTKSSNKRLLYNEHHIQYSEYSTYTMNTIYSIVNTVIEDNEQYSEWYVTIQWPERVCDLTKSLIAHSDDV